MPPPLTPPQAALLDRVIAAHPKSSPIHFAAPMLFTRSEICVFDHEQILGEIFRRKKCGNVKPRGRDSKGVNYARVMFLSTRRRATEEIEWLTPVGGRNSRAAMLSQAKDAATTPLATPESDSSTGKLTCVR
jgi:hypothetical protein